jgi:hypothetical protein
MSKGPCSVEGCEKQIDRRGYCRAHLRRWERHGDPLGGGISYGKTARYIEAIAVPYKGDDCLIWPFGGDGHGYGSAHFNGKHIRAHRLVCIMAHGEPDSPDMQAAHSCGNGAHRCVNPNHLRWATPVENAQDKYEHGTMPLGHRSGTAKVTAEQVLQIRELAANGTTYRAISKQFSISMSHVQTIVAKRKWKWLSSRNDLIGLAALEDRRKAEVDRIDREEREVGR